MEIIEPPTLKKIIMKVIWDNLIQFLAFVFVMILLIIQWNSVTSGIRIGAITMMLAYFMIRIGIAYQSLKFERDIKKEKEGKKEVNLPDL